MTIRKNVEKLFKILFLIGVSQALIHDGLAKVFGTNGRIVTNTRTNQLLNQLCSESQAANVMQRDACYGCFFRASQQPSGYPTLLSMAECANRYLNGTDYGHCSAYLRNVTGSVNAGIAPTRIYCTFLECIRRVNKDNLEALKMLTREAKGNHWKEGAKYYTKKAKLAFAIDRYIVALRGICIVRDNPADTNTVRPGAEPINPRRSNYIDPNMRRGGYKNIFQFYINGREAGPTFREYDRVYPGEDTVFSYESDNGGFPADDRRYD